MTVPSERSDRTSPDRENIRYGVRIPYTGSNRETRHVSRDTSSTGHRWYGVITDGVDNGRYKRERKVFTCTAAAAATIPGPGSICRVRLRSSRRSPKARRFAVQPPSPLMHSLLARGNAVLAYTLSVLVTLTFACFMSTIMVDYRTETEMKTLKIEVWVTADDARQKPYGPRWPFFFFFSARTYRSTASPRSSTTSVTSRSISTQISFFRSVSTRRCRLLAPPRVYIWSDMNRVQTAPGGFLFLIDVCHSGRLDNIIETFSPYVMLHDVHVWTSPIRLCCGEQVVLPNVRFFFLFIRTYVKNKTIWPNQM